MYIWRDTLIIFNKYKILLITNPRKSLWITANLAYLYEKALNYFALQIWLNNSFASH